MSKSMSKTRHITTWVITAFIALAFVGAGFAKVSGHIMMVQSFESFGLPDWFRITIGSIELLGGVLLLIPALTGTAAFGLSVIMLGAVGCHVMFTPISQAIPAIVFFLLLAYVYLTRKNVIPAFLRDTLVGE